MKSIKLLGKQAFGIPLRFFVVLFFLSTRLFSQENCHLDVKLDEFTKQKTTTSREATIFNVGSQLIGKGKPWDLGIFFAYFNDDSLKIFLDVASQTDGASISRVSFRFSNDSVIIKDQPSFGPEYNKLGYSIVYTRFTISKKELQIFASSTLAKIRVELIHPVDIDPLVEKEVKAKSAERIKNDAICMAKEIK
jgi:hypothetical protein